MVLEVNKFYKHKKGLVVKILGIDGRKFLDIRYSDGRKGKLILEAPGFSAVANKPGHL